MSNQIYSDSNKLSYNAHPEFSTANYESYKLPSIANGLANIPHMNESYYKLQPARFSTPPTSIYSANQCLDRYSSNFNASMTQNSSNQMNCSPPTSTNRYGRTPSYKDCTTNGSSDVYTSFHTCPSSPKTAGMCNTILRTPMNQGWCSDQSNTYQKTNIASEDFNKNLTTQETSTRQLRTIAVDPSSFRTSRPLNMNGCKELKDLVHNRCLANEILQKAGIRANITPNDCLEVITDAPVTMNDSVNCDPQPLCLKKQTDCRECYEQSIVVRHLQPPPAAAPPPIIIRERCTSQSLPQPPIIIRQTPARPATPPPLIIRECPPSMPNVHKPTIIEREVPPPPPPPRQVIIERLPTPPPKPRTIILEKWLPYEYPKDRPCIVEKATNNETCSQKNLIIQYEAVEPKIQAQCTDEGISFVDPQQYVNEKSNENAELCYVDQLDNLPDYIRCQLTPQALAAIGIHTNDVPKILHHSNTGRTKSPYPNQPKCFPKRSSTVQRPTWRSTTADGCRSTKPIHSQQYNTLNCRQQTPYNRALSASAVSLSQYKNKCSTAIPLKGSTRGFTNLPRAQYNPWATTYQVSYTNKARTTCRTR